MKVYDFSFKGLWMGGTIIIIAKNEIDALRIATEHINKDRDLGDLQKKDLGIVEVHEIEEKIIFYDNGDY